MVLGRDGAWARARRRRRQGRQGRPPRSRPDLIRGDGVRRDQHDDLVSQRRDQGALPIGQDQFPGQIAAPAVGVRPGHPVGLRAHHGDQVAAVGRQPGRAHQRGDLGRRGALATPGREHRDDRLGQLAVPGAGGIQPGPF